MGAGPRGRKSFSRDKLATAKGGNRDLCWFWVLFLNFLGLQEVKLSVLDMQQECLFQEKYVTPSGKEPSYGNVTQKLKN